MRILTPAAAEASSLDSTPVDVTVHDVRFSQIWSGIDKLLMESQKYLEGPNLCCTDFPADRLTKIMLYQSNFMFKEVATFQL